MLLQDTTCQLHDSQAGNWDTKVAEPIKMDAGTAQACAVAGLGPVPAALLTTDLRTLLQYVLTSLDATDRQALQPLLPPGAGAGFYFCLCLA